MSGAKGRGISITYVLGVDSEAKRVFVVWRRAASRPPRRTCDPASERQSLRFYAICNKARLARHTTGNFTRVDTRNRPRLNP